MPNFYISKCTLNHTDGDMASDTDAQCVLVYGCFVAVENQRLRAYATLLFGLDLVPIAERLIYKLDGDYCSHWRSPWPRQREVRVLM